MELRIDRLLSRLRHEPERVLEAIDRDPLLVRREKDGLILANATKELFTPREEHQLFAKGIVYRRDPYELVSLPLLKIHNLGERDVTVRELAALTAEGASVSFLRKFDGSMIQRFQHDGRVWFTTRGMLEGLSLGPTEDETHFDYLGAVRRIALNRFPELLQARPEWDQLTFVLELLHPGGRIITDYGDREDLVLLTVYDRQAHRYWTHRETHRLAADHSLCVTDVVTVSGHDLASQIDHMLAGIKGTDEEGCVINFETTEVLYRVKVKSPDYLRLLKLMVHCTYDATVEMLKTAPSLPSWPEFEETLKSRGAEKVPEEVLGVYREHYEKYAVFLRDCEHIREWAIRRTAALLTTIPEADPKTRRRLFAEAVRSEPLKALLFSACDGRLTTEKAGNHFESPEEANRVADALELPPRPPHI